MYRNEFLIKETCKGCILEMLFFKKHVGYLSCKSFFYLKNNIYNTHILHVSLKKIFTIYISYMFLKKKHLRYTYLTCFLKNNSFRYISWNEFL